MISRVFFREDVLLPNNRRERTAWRNPPAGHKPYDLQWHTHMGTAIGVSLTNDGKMYVYPMNMIEFVECIVETTYKDEVIKSTSAVEIAASKAKSKPFASPDRKGRML